MTERITGSFMLKQVCTFLKSPLFPEDEDKNRRARYDNEKAIAFFAVIIVYETGIRLFLNYKGFSVVDLIFCGLAVICGTGLVLLRKGFVRFTSIVLVVIIWIASNSLAASGFGVKDASYILNFAIILMAGLLLGWQASLITTIISIASGFGLANAEANGLISIAPYPVRSFARDMAFTFGLNAVLIYLLINGLENALKKTRANLDKFETAKLNLNFTQTELKNRSEKLLVANKH